MRFIIPVNSSEMPEPPPCRLAHANSAPHSHQKSLLACCDVLSFKHRPLACSLLMSAVTSVMNAAGGSSTPPGGCGSMPRRCAHPCHSSSSFIGTIVKASDRKIGMCPTAAGRVGRSIPSRAAARAFSASLRYALDRPATSSIGTTVGSPSCEANFGVDLLAATGVGDVVR